MRRRVDEAEPVHGAQDDLGLGVPCFTGDSGTRGGGIIRMREARTDCTCERVGVVCYADKIAPPIEGWEISRHDRTTNGQSIP